MTLHYGDTGKGSVGTLKRFDFVQPTPFEDNVELTPGGQWTSSLPLSQAESIKVDFFVTEADLPTIAPAPISMGYCAFAAVGGVNYTAGSTASVYFAWYLNDVAIVAGSGNYSVNANLSKNWMQSQYRFPDVKIGDKISVQIWANGAGISYEYKSMYIAPTRVQLAKKGTIYKDLFVSDNLTVNATKNWTSPYSGASTGTLSSPSHQSGVVYVCDSTSTNYFALNVNVSPVGYTFPYVGHPTDYIFRMNSGDLALNGASYTHSSLKYYVLPRVPKYIQFRELSL